ncbi:hypothetical protein [Haloarchaeobius sp. DFWS5]|uniref:hypothetical protein n=1 Tax=Haloarchaeobius sp. DFWS5 TaxID=3446114 RepID=UPI003EBE4E9F
MVYTYDSGGGGGAIETDTPSTTTSDGDEYSLHDAIGSGGLQTSVDEDTGRAEQTIGGGNSGPTVTYGESQEDDIHVFTNDGSDTIAEVEEDEQSLENALDGLAFGDPDEVDDIGSGSAVEDTTPDDQPNNTPAMATAGSDNLVMYAVVALAVLAVVFSGGA